MMQLLENEDLARTPIIVLANKQDLKDAMQV
jgi:GTPase SAR1 family protein